MLPGLRFQTVHDGGSGATGRVGRVSFGRSSYPSESKAVSMSAPVVPVIEVFADVWCPFAHVGLRAVDEQRRLSGPTNVAILVKAWPLELVNGATLDPVAARHHADELRHQVAPGMFRDLDADHFPKSTLDALALAARAYRADVRIGEELSFALRTALFEEGQDISDPVVLKAIADRFGTGMPDEADHAAVLADWREGQGRGVLGSPHFFCGGADAFCPSLRITKDPVDGMSIVKDLARVTAFLHQCFEHFEVPDSSERG